MLRLIARAAGVSVATLVFYAVWAVGSLALRPWPRARLALHRSVVRSWSRTLCALMGVRHVLVGDPPRGPGVLVCNHLSYLDILVLGCHAPGVFVAKAEIRSWPVIGLLATSSGSVYVERSRKRALPGVNRAIQAVIEGGGLVVVFPEGTSSRGETVLPFRASLLAPAAELGAPVWTATLRYATRPGDPPASQAVCWWGTMTFTPHVLGLLRLSGIEARVTFGAEAVRENDRKCLADELWRRVRAPFEPVE